MLRKVFFVFSILLLSIISPVFAEENVDNATSETRQEKKEIMLQNREQRQEEREALKAQLELQREEVKTRIAEKRKEMKEEIQAKREEFKKKLAEIADARKQAAVERIDKRLANINKNRTDHFMRSLERMKTLLERVASTGEALKAKGHDTTNLESAVTKANEAIASAKAAVEEQAGKDYTVELGEDDNLHDVMKEMKDKLQEDLSKTREFVKTAKDAVMDAAEALAKIRG